jgi:hypothetical protein
VKLERHYLKNKSQKQKGLGACLKCSSQSQDPAFKSQYFTHTRRKEKEKGGKSRAFDSAVIRKT